MDNKKLLMRSVLMRHISGLPEYKKGRLIVLGVYGDRLEFNSKQIIPLSRIKNCEIGQEAIALEPHPIASAIGFGLLSAYIGSWLSYLSYGESISFISFICGGIGAIVGAISGLKPRKRNVTLLRINYRNIEGENSIIRIVEKSKSRKLITQLADTINNAVGYTPTKETEQFSAKRYEI